MSIELMLDDYDLPSFCEHLRLRKDGEFHYVVTPNVDHVIRYYEDREFRRCYTEASYVLLDSRLLARLLSAARFGRRPPRVCTGSDLTYEIFSRLLLPDDRVVLVGGTSSQAQVLRQRFGLRDLHHIDPPMGFINDPASVTACLCAIEETSPFRFCFFAIGSPQQELIAYRIKLRGRTHGMALCVGASINFLTGQERRAPHWVQRMGFEWLFRLVQDPGRLARRYLIRGPRIFGLLPRIELRVRSPSEPGAPDSQCDGSTT